MKKVYKFECPNCGSVNQNNFLAKTKTPKHENHDPLMICVRCSSDFSSKVLERVYYMGYTRGAAKND